MAHSAGRPCTRSIDGHFRCCGHALTRARASERASERHRCMYLRRDSPTSAPGLARVSVRLAALLRRSMLRQSGLRAAVTAAQQYEARGSVLHRLAAPASKLAPRPLQQFKSRASTTAYRSIARRRRTRDNPISRFRWILRGVCCYVRYSWVRNDAGGPCRLGRFQPHVATVFALRAPMASTHEPWREHGGRLLEPTCADALNRAL